jgi:AraC-like DNA-binding protein
MNIEQITPDSSISLFVKNIVVYESNEKINGKRIRFFADGYPGLMFQKTENGLIVRPHNKVMPEIFIYGQTIQPIELEINGPYSIIVFQLYPFVLKSFFNVDPQSINDDCYYLNESMGVNINELVSNLMNSDSIEQRVEIISGLLLHYFEKQKQDLDFNIRQAIEIIILSNGQERIQSIAEKSGLNLRTFERRFLTVTGLTAKQFAKIIQFQTSLQQLTVKDYKKLTDIVYENGFSDQSHFIRVFKAFTGKTPKTFKI